MKPIKNRAAAHAFGFCLTSLLQWS